jgi:hypothetical protein
MQTLTVLFTLFAAISALDAAPKGLKIQWVGHSFHMFLPSPVAKLAREAGIKGHTDVGKDMIGGSSPCEHWNRAYPEAKQAGGFVGGGGGKSSGGKDLRSNLDAGIPDVVTLATQQAMPEPCIGKFAMKFVHALDWSRHFIQVLICIFNSSRRRNSQERGSWSKKRGCRFGRWVPPITRRQVAAQ